MAKEYYVYGLYVNEDQGEVLRYVGKGHSDSETGYDRISCYMRHPSLRESQVSAMVQSKLVEMEESGRKWSIRKIDILKSETEAYTAEKAYIRASPGLWNQNEGGFSGFTLKDSSKRKMSLSRIGVPLGKLSFEARRNISLAKKGKSLSDEHRKKISAGLSKSDERDSRIFFEHDCLVPIFRRQGHNALLSPTEEVEFLKEFNGKLTADELRKELSGRLSKEVSVCGIYSLIKRYRGSTLTGKLTVEEKRQRRISLTVTKHRDVAADRLGIDVGQLISERSAPDDWGINKTVYIVHGVSCSGKSWVCKQLEDLGIIRYVSYDRAGSFNARFNDLRDASFQEKPIVFDVLRNAMSYQHKNPFLKIKYVCIVETAEVIAERALLRGAKINTVSLITRINRVRSIAKRHAVFEGTSAEVFSWLKNRFTAS